MLSRIQLIECPNCRTKIQKKSKDTFFVMPMSSYDVSNVKFLKRMDDDLGIVCKLFYQEYYINIEEMVDHKYEPGLCSLANIKS